MPIYEKLTKFAFYGLAALMPVFFLPVSYNASGMDNSNKLVLFLLGLVLIFVLLALKPEKFSINKASFSFLDAVLLLWLALNFLAALYGNSFHTSFFGAFGSFNAPLLALTALVFWYFIVKETELFFAPAFLAVMIYTAGAVSLVLSVLFALAGLGRIAPDHFLFGLARLGVGTTEQFSIYLALIAVLAAGLLLANSALFKKQWQKAAALAAIFLALILLVVFNFFPAWLCLSAGLTVLLIGYLFHKFKEKSIIFSQAFILFIMVFAVSGFFLAFHLLNPQYYPSGQRLAPRLQLDWASTGETALDALKRRPWLGYGTEMFAPANSLARRAEDNAKPYWYVRFNQGSSFFFEQLVYSGLAGFGAWAVLLLAVCLALVRLLFFGQGEEGRPGLPGYLLPAALAALIAGLLVYSANLVLLFLFFTFLALLARRYRALFPAQFIQVQGRKSTPRALALVFTVLAGLAIVLLIFNLKNLAAAAYFESANGQAGGAQESRLKTAAGLNPRVYQYHLKLAEYYHRQALNALQQSDGSDNRAAQDYANNAITAAKDAITAAPWAVAPYENLGKIYRDLGAYSADTYPLAAEFFEKALEKEPTNPVLWTEIGIVYLRQGRPADAVNALSRARELKEKYYQAEYNLAKALIAADQNAPALAILDELAREYPNIDVIYEQGKAHFNLKQYEPAIQKFSQVIGIEPLHANALYSLGLSYSALGEVEAAMYYLRKTADLNPDNFNLLEQISALENEEDDKADN